MCIFGVLVTNIMKVLPSVLEQRVAGSPAGGTDELQPHTRFGSIETREI